jgi:hypothetical protein
LAKSDLSLSLAKSDLSLSIGSGTTGDLVVVNART